MRSLRTAVVPVSALAAVTLVAGCHSGGSSAAANSSSATTTSASASGSTGTTATDAAAACPTSNTRSFAKTRFVTDIGLTAGTFHRYIYKPYKAGTYKKGAPHRISTIAKGVGILALDVHLMSNAKKNVMASPLLCKSLYVPISDATAKLGALKSEIASGSITDMAAVESDLSNIMGTSAKNGTKITETTDTSQANNG